MSADSDYGVSSWEVRTTKSSSFAGLFRWFALPVLDNGITVEAGDYFGGTGYVTELGALEAGRESLRRRGLKLRNG